MIVLIPVLCPHGQRDQVLRHTARGVHISPAADDSDVTYPRTRLGRKTLCFAKSRQMHDMVI